MGLKSVHSRLLSTSLHYNMTKHVYCRWAWSLYTAVYCWLVYTTIWQSVLLSMGLKSVHNRLLSTSLQYNMTERVYCRWAWSLYTAVYCRLVYTTVWQNVFTVDGPEVCTAVYCWLVYTTIWQNVFTVDGPEVCTQPFTVDESTLQYDKACYCRWAWSLYTAVYCWLVYTTIWQSVLLSMGLKSVHSRLLSMSLHYNMTKCVTVDGPEVCTQPFTVD